MRVLIVDDNPEFLRSLSRVITHLPAVQLAGTAESGEACLEQLPALQPDIVFLDLAMPGLGGLETLKAIKARFPHIRVVMVSLHRVEAYRQTALQAGADDFIFKNELYEHLPVLLGDYRGRPGEHPKNIDESPDE